MHKIIKTFKSRKKIIKLKDIMKAVYSAASNQIADLAKLNLKKALIPHQVERAEIEIKSLTHKELITVPKNSLTFLSGTTPPFTIIDNDSNLAGEYIVLPWELNSREGKDILKNIIKKIPFIPQSLTYTLYINLEENTNPLPQANQDITQALSVVTQSVEDYSWSDDSFTEDNVEGLLQEIEKLKKEIEAAQNNYNNAKNDVTAKNRQISNLQIQVNNLNGQINQKQLEINNLNNQLSQKNNQYTNISNQLASAQTQNSGLNKQLQDARWQAGNNDYKFLNAKSKLDMIRQGGDVYMCSDLGDAVQFRVSWFTGSFRVYRDANFNNKHFQIWRSQEQYNKLIV